MRVNIVSYISRQFETRQLDCTLFYSTDESKLAQKDDHLFSVTRNSLLSLDSNVYGVVKLKPT